MKRKLYIASDHAGFDLKSYIVSYMENTGLSIEDLGTDSAEETDYPAYAHLLASKIEHPHDLGILICGSGQGMSITANKYPHIRAALCWTKSITKLARQHNDANILCLPARFLSHEESLGIILTFLGTAFEEEHRHQRRLEQISPST